MSRKKKWLQAEAYREAEAIEIAKSGRGSKDSSSLGSSGAGLSQAVGGNGAGVSPRPDTDSLHTDLSADSNVAVTANRKKGSLLSLVSLRNKIAKNISPGSSPSLQSAPLGDTHLPLNDSQPSLASEPNIKPPSTTSSRRDTSRKAPLSGKEVLSMSEKNVQRLFDSTDPSQLDSVASERPGPSRPTGQAGPVVAEPDSLASTTRRPSGEHSRRSGDHSRRSGDQSGRSEDLGGRESRSGEIGADGSRSGGSTSLGSWNGSAEEDAWVATTPYRGGSYPSWGGPTTGDELVPYAGSTAGGGEVGAAGRVASTYEMVELVCQMCHGPKRPRAEFRPCPTCWSLYCPNCQWWCIMTKKQRCVQCFYNDAPEQGQHP